MGMRPPRCLLYKHNCVCVGGLLASTFGPTRHPCRKQQTRHCHLRQPKLAAQRTGTLFVEVPSPPEQLVARKCWHSTPFLPQLVSVTLRPPGQGLSAYGQRLALPALRKRPLARWDGMTRHGSCGLCCSPFLAGLRHVYRNRIGAWHGRPAKLLLLCLMPDTWPAGCARERQQGCLRRACTRLQSRPDGSGRPTAQHACVPCCCGQGV